MPRFDLSTTILEPYAYNGRIGWRRPEGLPIRWPREEVHPSKRCQIRTSADAKAAYNEYLEEVRAIVQPGQVLLVHGGLAPQTVGGEYPKDWFNNHFYTEVHGPAVLSEKELLAIQEKTITLYFESNHWAARTAQTRVHSKEMALAAFAEFQEVVREKLEPGKSAHVSCRLDYPDYNSPPAWFRAIEWRAKVTGGDTRPPGGPEPKRNRVPQLVQKMEKATLDAADRLPVLLERIVAVKSSIQEGKGDFTVSARELKAIEDAVESIDKLLGNIEGHVDDVREALEMSRR